MNAFSNTSLQIQDMTIESSSDTIAFYGTLELRRTAESLEDAKRLYAVLKEAIKTLEAGPLDTSPAIDPAAIQTIKNPFA